MTAAIKTWIKEHLLDKNGYPSRLRKKKYLTPEKLTEMKASCDYLGDDVNCLIRFILNDLTQRSCPECGGPILNVYHKNPQPMFCSITCLNKSDFMSDTISKIQRKNVAENGDKILEKRKKTNLERYGVEHQLQRKGLAEQAAKAGIEKKLATNRRKRQEYLESVGLFIITTATDQVVEFNDPKTYNKLHEMFFEETLPINVMAERIGCSWHTICTTLKELNWYRRRRSRSKEDI